LQSSPNISFQLQSGVRLRTWVKEAQNGPILSAPDDVSKEHQWNDDWQGKIVVRRKICPGSL